MSPIGALARLCERLVPGGFLSERHDLLIQLAHILAGLVGSRGWPLSAWHRQGLVAYIAPFEPGGEGFEDGRTEVPERPELSGALDSTMSARSEVVADGLRGVMPSDRFVDAGGA